MASAPLYNQDGTQTGTTELPKEVFDVTVSPELVWQVVVAHRANSRKVLAHTKMRGEVRGGGKKPWRQKGTGRARAGSTRSPIWRGGGVVFGPRKNRNYAVQINAKMKRKALLGALSDKARDQKIIIVEQLELSEPKTKILQKILKNFSLQAKKVLIALPGKGDYVLRAAKNLSKAYVTEARSLHVQDVLSADTVLLPKEAVAVLEKTFVKK